MHPIHGGVALNTCYQFMRAAQARPSLAARCRCFGIAKASDSADVRLVAEAKELFRAVLADEDSAKDWELRSTWQADQIPGWVARKYFGLRMHADPSGSSSLSGSSYLAPALSVKDVLDFAGDREIVCSDDKAESIASERFSSEGDFDPKRAGYTFPVFSDDYRSAALICFSRCCNAASGWASWRHEASLYGRGVRCYLHGDKRRLAAHQNYRAIHQLTALSVAMLIGAVFGLVRCVPPP